MNNIRAIKYGCLKLRKKWVAYKYNSELKIKREKHMDSNQTKQEGCK